MEHDKENELNFERPDQETRISGQPAEKPDISGEFRRRRRSDSYTEQPAADFTFTKKADKETSATQTKQDDIPAFLRRPQFSQETGTRLHEVPKEGAPRPASLKRNADGTKKMEEVRTPVKEPGYTRQKPLGTASDEKMSRSAASASRARKPATSVPTPAPEKKGKKRAMTIALAVILVIGVCAITLLLTPMDANNPLGAIRRTLAGQQNNIASSLPEVRDFTTSATSGSTPLDIVFLITTDPDAEDVRLTDDNGHILDTDQDDEPAINAQGKVWCLRYTYDEPFTGMITPEVAGKATKNGEVIWYTADKNVLIQVVASPMETIAPTAEPTEEPTAEPTEVPTVEPTAEPTATGIPMATVVAVVVTAEPEDDQIETVDVDVDEWTEETTEAPTMQPMEAATAIPEEKPTVEPTSEPKVEETDIPTAAPTIAPTEVPTAEPTVEVTEAPTAVPTVEPTEEPTVAPTVEPTEEPTAVPTAEPTEEPTVAPTAEPTAEPTVKPGADAVMLNHPTITVTAADEQELAKVISSSTIYSAARTLNAYEREAADAIVMPFLGEYVPKEAYGVLTFRNDAFRQNAASGRVGDINNMEVLWEVPVTESLKSASGTNYYGFGVYSQPAIIQWSKEVREMSNMNDEAKEISALREVIFAGENGRIYFLNLADGTATREALKIGYPMHATPSIHAYGFPMMTIGQYAKKINGIKKPTIGLRYINLLNGKQEFLQDGLDGTNKRYTYDVGSFETSALVDARSDSLITAGTNGLFYMTKMNTRFDRNNNTITVNPESIVLKTVGKNERKNPKRAAVEASVAAYQHYAWYADMDGLLRCVDLDTMNVLWAVNTGDAVQATVALDMDADDQLWVYTANTVTNRTKGAGHIRRINALTGEEDWTLAVALNYSKKFTAGAVASPVIGQNRLEDLVYFTISGLKGDGAEAIGLDHAPVNGALIAINKESGAVVWAKPLDEYTYSSPVAVYDEAGYGWIIQACSNGTVTLYDGLSGTEISSLELKGTINSSPAVYRNMMVIGTQGGKSTSFIYGIELK